MPDSNEYIENQDKDYKLIIASDLIDNSDDTIIITAENIQKQSESWMYEAMKHFEKGGRQYSVKFNEDSSSTSNEITLDDIKELALNAQNDISKIRKINILVRQAETEDDIIGKVHETIESNLNANVKLSFDELPADYDIEIKNKVEGLIKRFHKEVNINDVMTTAITSTYDEGNCIQYLRSKKNGNIYHHVIDKYPLGVALISDYSLNGIPYVLINTSELSNRLQKTTLKNKKNKPLFFANISEEIKNNYPKEVIDAYIAKEKYAKLDIRRTGVNRFGNMGRTYGVSPVFKALKPKIMLDTFDKSDSTNSKVKAKKIITQIMRKETMGNTYEKKGLEDMAYAHSCLMAAWANPTVVYTPPPCVEKVEYVEPKIELTNESTVKQCRSRVTSALGISFLNTDGQQTVSTANISIKQLMRTINKIAERQEIILQRWYEVILEEAGIPIEYCPTPKILDAELLEFSMKKDLSEFLYSKLNCSFKTAYEILDMSYEEEKTRRKKEKNDGIDDIFTPHATSFNSSGDINSNGRPSGTINRGNEVNEEKTEYDKNYQKSKIK
jgi:hypothetical protein|nr:MAG TPA: hypothetical protein [Caudoviricetes sp.]